MAVVLFGGFRLLGFLSLLFLLFKLMTGSKLRKLIFDFALAFFKLGSLFVLFFDAQFGLLAFACKVGHKQQQDQSGKQCKAPGDPIFGCNAKWL